jgi:hypothetical protein
MATTADIDTALRPERIADPPQRAGLASGASLPEIAELAGAIALYSFLSVLFLRAFYIADPDIWCHLHAGHWILAHHAVPVTDTFSSYGMGKRWIDYSWLFDTVSALVFGRLGLIAIPLYEIAVRLALSVALFHLVRGLLGGYWRALALTAVSLYAMVEVIGPRPGMLTTLFVILEFDILLSARRTGHTKTLWLLPPMFALWANWHIQFVYGLFVLGVFACEPWLDAFFRYRPQDQNLLPAKQVWLALAASAAATLLSPYGAKVYWTVFLFMGDTGAYNAISELKAMTFRQPQDFIVLLMALSAAMAMGWRRDAKPLWLIFLIVTSLMAFRSVREVWFLVTVAACVIADGWNLNRPRASSFVSARVRLATAVCVLAVLAVACRHYGLSNNLLDIQVSGNFPEGASRFVEQHHLSGPLLNDLSWGGFLMWRLPQLPVAIDGRLDVHGDARIQEFSDLWKGKPGWASDPELARANLVLTPRDAAIASLLRGDPRFSVAYEDVQAVIFQRR